MDLCRMALIGVFAGVVTGSAFAQPPPQVTFNIHTRGDDLRADSQAIYEVESDDGRVIGGWVLGRLPDRTSTTRSFNLPAGITSTNLRFVRIYFGPGRPLEAHTIPDLLWQGDQWEMSFDAEVTDATGTRSLFRSPVHKFEHPGWLSNLELRPQRLPVTTARRFAICIYTGDDDLRTDPHINPNSELDVFVNMTDGRQLRLDTGRTTHRNFVGTEDTAFYGSFKSWGIAYGMADAPESIPLAQIQSFSVQMVPGRAPPGTLRGSEPFRGDDQWTLNGLWIGVDPTGRAVASLGHGDVLVGGTVTGRFPRVFSQWNIMAKLKAGQAWGSAAWH
jgi:hypothetical protein